MENSLQLPRIIFQKVEIPVNPSFILIVLIVVAVVVFCITRIPSARNTSKTPGFGIDQSSVGQTRMQVGYTMDGQPIYQNQGSSETNPFAIVALILGILTGLLGIIFGHIALNQIEAKGQQGRGMAWPV